MPHVPRLRSSHLAFALMLTGCLDPAFSSEGPADASGLLAEDGSNERKRNFGLYVDPDSNAADQADIWRTSYPDGAARMDVIASQQIGIWLGDWIGDVRAVVDDAVTEARAAYAVQTFVVYNIPNRDCGYWSAGGVAAAEYELFIDEIAAGLDGRPAIVVVEPDGLALDECLTEDGKIERHALISYAVDTLTAAGGRVYIDAGDSNWIPSGEMADRLLSAGVQNAKGFALNVSHNEFTANEVAYAEEIRAIVGTQAHYVVDTSRNGLGPAPDNEWCNAAGRALGDFPNLETGIEGFDAKLWIKRPGESDGECHGGPPAGHWWPEYADELAINAGF